MPASSSEAAAIWAAQHSPKQPNRSGSEFEVLRGAVCDGDVSVTASGVLLQVRCEAVVVAMLDSSRVMSQICTNNNVRLLDDVGVLVLVKERLQL